MKCNIAITTMWHFVQWLHVGQWCEYHYREDPKKTWRWPKMTVVYICILIYVPSMLQESHSGVLRTEWCYRSSQLTGWWYRTVTDTDRQYSLYMAAGCGACSFGVYSQTPLQTVVTWPYVQLSVVKATIGSKCNLAYNYQWDGMRRWHVNRPLSSRCLLV